LCRLSPAQLKLLFSWCTKQSWRGIWGQVAFHVFDESQIFLEKY
jgi:uncharacterized protein YhbP (UPF0306 family)